MACCCAPHIVWAVETNGIVLIDQKNGKDAFLAYPEAIVWDMLSRRRPVEKIEQLLESGADLKDKSARRFLESVLSDWLKNGWLERVHG